MEEKPRTSVVIPTFKSRERTLRCLAALWLCNPQPDEVIVVDDGSEDNTAHSVLRKYPRHIVVRLPLRQGFAAAANQGLARASGDLLVLLDNNVEVAPPAIGATVEAFTSRNDLGVAGAALHDADGVPIWSGGRLPGSIACFVLASGLPSLINRYRLWKWVRSHSAVRKGRVDWVCGLALAVRRSVWNEVGPFDLSYRSRGRYLEMCTAATDSGWRVEIVPGFRAVLHVADWTPSEGPAVGHVDDQLPWTDILRFADKRNGAAAARQSGRALQMGGRLRLLGRNIASPLVPRDLREDWQAETSAYAEALRAIASPAYERRPAPPT